MRDETGWLYEQLERCRSLREVLIDADDRAALDAYETKLEARLKGAVVRSSIAASKCVSVRH